MQLLKLVLCNYELMNPNWNYIKELTIAWYLLQKTGRVCTFVAQRFVTALLAFNLGFEGVPVIWVKLFLVSEVLRYTGRLRKPDIGSFRFKRHFLGPLHFLHPLSGGHGTRLSISSWDEGPCLMYACGEDKRCRRTGNGSTMWPTVEEDTTSATPT